MLNETLSPVDTCGCGDTGYLTSRTLPIALENGPGKVLNVPVYSCGNSMCNEYTVPSLVASRLDSIAEEMERSNHLTQEFTWESAETAKEIDATAAITQAFTWKFLHRVYEDAQVVLVIPGDTVLFQSRVDPTEYYTLKYLPDVENEIVFSFSKFFEEDTDLTYEKYLELEYAYLKELGTLKMDEAEDALIEEFGEISL